MLGGVLLDSEAGTLRAKRNGELLTVREVMVLSDDRTGNYCNLTGNYCWAAILSNHGTSMPITELDPAAF